MKWFRRSRGADRKPEREAEFTPAATDAPSSQPRPPLRIRNLLLLNLQPSDGVDKIEAAPPLGSREGVVTTISSALPGIRFEEGRGELNADDHRVTIDLGRGDPVHAAVAAAEGDSGIEMLRGLLQRAGWRAYAPRAGVFIEPDALDLFALPDATTPRWS